MSIKINNEIEDMEICINVKMNTLLMIVDATIKIVYVIFFNPEVEIMSSSKEGLKRKINIIKNIVSNITTYLFNF